MGPGQGFWYLLSQDEQNSLRGLGMAKDYSPGATICHEGDPATHVYILLAGWVKILSSTKDGHAIMLALRSAGDIVGEVAGETTGHRNATIRAVDAVQALIVRHDKFSSFLDSNQRANRAHRRIVTQKWNDTDTMLRRRAGTTGAQRLAALLLDLADRHGHGADGARYLVMPLTQDELASLAGTSRATVTRAFNNWRKRGFVLTRPHHVTILDQTALRKVAGQ
jgi:CRP/FNR family transcriptional regulator, cyclic AMP receptor protein